MKKTIKFPKDFLWGGAIASNQADGLYERKVEKGLSIADYTFCKKVKEKDDRAEFTSWKQTILKDEKDQNYAKRRGIHFFETFETDLALMKELGLKAFRTSIDWSYVCPKGIEEQPNQDALLYYDALIDCIIKNGMEPVITLSHYEMPAYLSEVYHGWIHKEVIDHFVRFAGWMLERYHKKVSYWITFNSN